MRIQPTRTCAIPRKVSKMRLRYCNHRWGGVRAITNNRQHFILYKLIAVIAIVREVAFRFSRGTLYIQSSHIIIYPKSNDYANLRTSCRFRSIIKFKKYLITPFDLKTTKCNSNIIRRNLCIWDLFAALCCIIFISL